MQITDSFIGGLFKYFYGMSSEEQQKFLEKLLAGKSRRKVKRNGVFGTRGAYRELDHLRRLHRSGRSKPNPAESLYDGQSLLFSEIPKTFEFVGKEVCVPIRFGEEKT